MSSRVRRYGYKTHTSITQSPPSPFLRRQDVRSFYDILYNSLSLYTRAIFFSIFRDRDRKECSQSFESAITRLLPSSQSSPIFFLTSSFPPFSSPDHTRACFERITLGKFLRRYRRRSRNRDALYSARSNANRIARVHRLLVAHATTPGDTISTATFRIQFSSSAYISMNDATERPTKNFGSEIMLHTRAVDYVLNSLFSNAALKQYNLFVSPAYTILLLLFISLVKF